MILNFDTIPPLGGFLSRYPMNEFQSLGCPRVIGNKKCGGPLQPVCSLPSVSMTKCRVCGQTYTVEVWVDEGLTDYQEGAACARGT